MGHTTQAIRNVALVGQAGGGKTTLAEALLAEAGAIPAKGSLQRGTTVSDFDPLERRLKHSLDSAVLSFERGGVRLNLIDTPGYPDFVGRTLAVLEAVESAAVVLGASSGIGSLTRQLMEAAGERGLGRLLVVNKIDAKDAQPQRLLAELEAAFGKQCLPVNLPAERGAAVVDCFFRPSPEPADFSSVTAAHTRLIDQVVEVDEALMALYLEQGEELCAQQLHDPFEKALREGHLIPVCFVSAESGAGIPQLLEVIARLMPSPLEGSPPPFLKGPLDAAERVTVVPDPARQVIVPAAATSARLPNAAPISASVTSHCLRSRPKTWTDPNARSICSCH